MKNRVVLKPRSIRLSSIAPAALIGTLSFTFAFAPLAQASEMRTRLDEVKTIQDLAPTVDGLIDQAIADPSIRDFDAELRAQDSMNARIPQKTRFERRKARVARRLRKKIDRILARMDTMSDARIERVLENAEKKAADWNPNDPAATAKFDKYRGMSIEEKRAELKASFLRKKDKLVDVTSTEIANAGGVVPFLLKEKAHLHSIQEQMSLNKTKKGPSRSVASIHIGLDTYTMLMAIAFCAIVVGGLGGLMFFGEDVAATAAGVGVLFAFVVVVLTMASDDD